MEAFVESESWHKNGLRTKQRVPNHRFTCCENVRSQKLLLVVIEPRETKPSRGRSHGMMMWTFLARYMQVKISAKVATWAEKSNYGYNVGLV